MKERPSTNRVLQSASDLRLLSSVYTSQDKRQEALAVLNDSRTGIASPVGGKNWDLVRRKIQLLQETQSWLDLWQFCNDLLEDASPDNLKNTQRTPKYPLGALGDDWVVWSGLLSAIHAVRADLK